MMKKFIKPNIENESALLKNNFFIKRVSGKFIVSSVLSMIFLYAASLIDTIIVGMFLGEEGLSAMSLVGPVYLVYYTIGATVGIGASILASRYLGKEDILNYQGTFTLATILLVLAAIIMTSLGYVFITPLSYALSGGSSALQHDLVKKYLLYYIPGGAFTLISYIPMYFLKTDGRPRASSMMFGLSAVINIILSWIFVNPAICNMGIGGASLATTISMASSAVLAFLLLLKGSEKLKFVRIGNCRKLFKKIVIAGTPNGLSNLLESARILLINMLLITVGASALLPCYTVVRNVSDLLSAVIIGVSSALIPLIGVFFGERDYVNERSVLKYSIRLGLCIVTPLILITCLVPDLFFGLFSVTDTKLIAEGRIALPLSCVGLVLAYINILYTGYLTSIKREALATVIVVLRLFAALAICAVPLAFSIGAPGIWISLSLCEVLTFAVFVIIRFVIRRKNKNIDKYFLDTSIEENADISFSVKNDINDIVFASEKVSEYCESVEVNMKSSMRAGNAIEEILMVLIKYCLGADKENYIDVRVVKLENEVLIRFRYIGKIFDPVAFLHENENNEDMEEELLGITMVEKTARLINFSQTFGANTLVIIF